MSDIRANTISDAAGTGPIALYKQSAAKAWVNFNGTGTIATRDSFNVSTLTDHGIGDYTNSFTNAMSSGDYVEVDGTVEIGSTRGTLIQGDTHSSLAASFRLKYAMSDDAADGTIASDMAFVKRGFFGDLA